MKMTMKATLALLALGALTLAVNAQNDNGPQGGDHQNGSRGHRPPPLPIVQALDVNHDGAIDANEIANAPAELKSLDKNGDGVLTADEYLPALPPDAPKDAPRPPTPAIIMALDVNHDGVIDSNETANASAELKTLDKNGDGVLTPDEFLGPRPQHSGGPDQSACGNSGGDDNNLPPGPPPGDDAGNTPPGPPPGQQ